MSKYKLINLHESNNTYNYYSILLTVNSGNLYLVIPPKELY